MKKKFLPLRILALIGAALFSAFVLWVGNSFVGNPISAHLADRAIAEYVSNNYTTLDLEIENAKYNFKFANYTAIARSRTNPDIRFMIYSRGGKVVHDDYTGYVLSGFNTLARLSEEYAARVKAMLEDNLDCKIQKVQMDYDTEQIQNLDELISPGMEFQKDLPIPVRLTVHTPIKQASYPQLSQLFSQIHHVMKRNSCTISEYSLFSEDDSLMVMANGVTPADIEGGSLENLLVHAQTYPDRSHILLSIRHKPAQ